MAEIADIAFRADDRELVKAKMSMQALGPASSIAGRGVDSLTNSLEQTSNAAGRTQSAATAAAKGMVSITSAAAAAARAENARATAALRAAQADDAVDMAAVKAARATQKKTAATLAAAAADEKAAQAAYKLALAQDQLNDQRPQRNPRNPPAANDDTGVKTHNVANLAAQGFDVVTTAAGGMQAGLIGMQQGLQIAQVAMLSTEGFAKTLAASFAAMLAPVVILSVGLTTLVAVLIQSVNWTKTAATAINWLADSLKTIAPYAAIAAAGIALIYAPAMISGIVQLIALMGRLATSALIAAGAFALANPAVVFVAGITAAVAAANIFRDELTQIFGRDIVGDAKTGVNAIIGYFVGGFNAIKAVWGQLPAAIGDVVYNAANMTIAGIETMINKSIELLNSMVNKVNDLLKSLPEWAQFGSIGTIGNVTIDRAENPYSGQLFDAAKKMNAEMKAAQQTDYVGGFTDAIAKGASKASEKLRELSKWITTTDDKKKKKGGKTEAEKYSDIVAGAERQIATLEAEQAAIGQTAFETARLKYETQLLNEAQQKGITLNEQQKNELAGLASYMANLEVETKRMKDAFEFAKSTTKSFFSDIRSGLAEGKTLWESFGDAAMNVLDKVIDKMLDNLIDAIFEVNKTAAGSGSGGGLGGFIGGLFGWLFNAKGNAFGKNGVQAFANGGAFTNSIVSQPTAFTYANGGAFGVMGEAGPEAIMPLSRGSDGSLGVRVTDANSGNSSQKSKGDSVIFADQNTFNIGEGADKQTVADLKKTLAERDKTFEVRVVKAVQKQRGVRNQDI